MVKHSGLCYYWVKGGEPIAWLKSMVMGFQKPDSNGTSFGAQSHNLTPFCIILLLKMSTVGLEEKIIYRFSTVLFVWFLVLVMQNVRFEARSPKLTSDSNTNERDLQEHYPSYSGNITHLKWKHCISQVGAHYRETKSSEIRQPGNDGKTKSTFGILWLSRRNQVPRRSFYTLPNFFYNFGLLTKEELLGESAVVKSARGWLINSERNQRMEVIREWGCRAMAPAVKRNKPLNMVVKNSNRIS